MPSDPTFYVGERGPGEGGNENYQPKVLAASEVQNHQYQILKFLQKLV